MFAFHLTESFSFQSHVDAPGTPLPSGNMCCFRVGFRLEAPALLAGHSVLLHNAGGNGACGAPNGTTAGGLLAKPITIRPGGSGG